MTSLLALNLGVELGKLLVLVVLIPALGLLFRYVIPIHRHDDHLVRARRAHGVDWMTERWATLRQFSFQWPVVDAAFLAGAMRWMMLRVVAAALLARVRRAARGKRSNDARDAA